LKITTVIYRALSGRERCHLRGPTLERAFADFLHKPLEAWSAQEEETDPQEDDGFTAQANQEARQEEDHPKTEDEDGWKEALRRGCQGAQKAPVEIAPKTRCQKGSEIPKGRYEAKDHEAEEYQAKRCRQEGCTDSRRQKGRSLARCQESRSHPRPPA
jgi:hypothetical protein